MGYLPRPSASGRVGQLNRRGKCTASALTQGYINAWFKVVTRRRAFVHNVKMLFFHLYHESPQGSQPANLRKRIALRRWKHFTSAANSLLLQQLITMNITVAAQPIAVPWAALRAWIDDAESRQIRTGSTAHISCTQLLALSHFTSFAQEPDIPSRDYVSELNRMFTLVPERSRKLLMHIRLFLTALQNLYSVKGLLSLSLPCNQLTWVSRGRIIHAGGVHACCQAITKASQSLANARLRLSQSKRFIWTPQYASRY